MKRRPKIDPPELVATREALCAVVVHLGSQLATNTAETTTLRADVASLRSQVADLPRAFDGKTVREVFGLVRESGQHAGRLQAQLDALGHPDALLALAADAAEAGLLEHLDREAEGAHV